MAAIDLFLSVFGGIVANLLIIVVRQIRDWHEARRKLREAGERAFQAALASESLSTLGGYLDRSLGQFLVSEYASSRGVKERVDLFLARLQEYVGTSNEVKRESQVAPPSEAARARSPIEDELSIVEEKLTEATPWDALATLRRLIEMRLSELARRQQVQLPERAGAGRILEVLRHNEIVPEGLAHSLRYSIEVSNRAIHGYQVSIAEADEAIRHTRLALSEFGLIRRKSDSEQGETGPR